MGEVPPFYFYSRGIVVTGVAAYIPRELLLVTLMAELLNAVTRGS